METCQTAAETDTNFETYTKSVEHNRVAATD